MKIYRSDRLKEKLLEFYLQERSRGRSPVEAKYSASQYVNLYVLGIIEHYTEWNDIEAIKTTLHHFRYFELYVYDSKSTENLEHMYMEHMKEAKSS